MSNIEPDIIDPGGPRPPPDGVPPEIDPNDDGLVGPDDIREPDDGISPIEPDPEEGGNGVAPIRT